MYDYGFFCDWFAFLIIFDDFDLELSCLVMLSDFDLCWLLLFRVLNDFFNDLFGNWVFLDEFFWFLGDWLGFWFTDDFGIDDFVSSFFLVDNAGDLDNFISFFVFYDFDNSFNITIWFLCNLNDLRFLKRNLLSNLFDDLVKLW